MKELRKLTGCLATVDFGKVRRGGISSRGQSTGSWTHWGRDWEQWLKPPRGCSCYQRCYPKKGSSSPFPVFHFSPSASHWPAYLEARGQWAWKCSSLRYRAKQGQSGKWVWGQTGHDRFKVIVPNSWWESSSKPSRNCRFLWQKNYSGT